MSRRSPSRRSPPPHREREFGGTRVYVGRLSSRTNEDDLEHKFGKYGRIRSVDLKNGYAFVEFEHEDDADDAVRHLDGIDLDSSRILVQFARGGGGRGYRQQPNPHRGTPPTRSEHRALFSYLPRNMSWQDLKDLCRQYAAPLFTDVYRERGVYKGVAEFRTREELKRALRELDDKNVDGERIECYEDRGRSRSRSRSRSPPRKRRRKDSGSSHERSRSPRGSPRGSLSPHSEQQNSKESPRESKQTRDSPNSRGGSPELNGSPRSENNHSPKDSELNNSKDDSSPHRNDHSPEIENNNNKSPSHNRHDSPSRSHSRSPRRTPRSRSPRSRSPSPQSPRSPSNSPRKSQTPSPQSP